MTNLAAETDKLIKELLERPLRAMRSEKRKTPECVIELVTPETARKYVSANIANRDIRPDRVVGHAAIMRRGDWKLTSNGVSFDTNGRLIDGQHRLIAVIVSGSPAWLVVVRGLEPESQDVMDTNLPRKLSDALKLRGEKNWNVLSAALRWSWRLDFIEATGDVHYGSLGLRPNTPQMIRYLDENPAIRECVRRVSNVAHQIPVRQPLFSALWLKMSYIDEELAGVFVDMLATGLEVSGDDPEPHPIAVRNPIYSLRRVLTLDRLNHNIKMPDYREAALISKAWNLWIDGNEKQTLTWKYGPGQKEKFPIIRGPLSDQEREIGKAVTREAQLEEEMADA